VSRAELDGSSFLPFGLLPSKAEYAVPVRLGMGVLALILMLVAEFGFVLWLRGLTIPEYLRTRDPISGTAYYVSLTVFAIMPLVIERTT